MKRSTLWTIIAIGAAILITLLVRFHGGGLLDTFARLHGAPPQH
jgi:hypothetical protein